MSQNKGNSCIFMQKDENIEGQITQTKAEETEIVSNGLGSDKGLHKTTFNCAIIFTSGFAVLPTFARATASFRVAPR